LWVCSGQLGTRPGDKGPELVEGGFTPQARRALENVGALLAASDLGWDQVVKTTVFLTDMADYGALNALYVEAIGDSRPARAVVAVQALPLGGLVEIEAWAYV
jgi:2-iminobutanoate/2-iminopropanoate deaminase